ncbi:MAG: hypothetical protein Kow0068_01070 [Marinilabiliales bacterium]
MVMKKFVSIAVILILFAALFSCKSDTNNNDENLPDKDTVTVTEQPKKNIVFIGLPSPIETSLILQRANVQYDASLLNPAENNENYSSSFSKALNLGIYSADMCFTSMYNQTQQSLEYLSVIKKMSDELGILDAVDKTIFDRMENNANEKDSLMNIISEVTMNAEIALKESDRKETSTTILIGGWIEGLFISAQIAKNYNNDELYQLIADHRLSLGSIFKMLDEYPDNQDFVKFKELLSPLKESFDNLTVTSTAIEVQTDPDSKITTLSSENKAEMNESIINEIAGKIAEIRNKITSGDVNL